MTKCYGIFLVLCLTLSCSRTITQEGLVKVIPKGEKQFDIMNFKKPIKLDPIEPGWYQHQFYWRKPMKISFVTKDKRSAIKLLTKNSASVLFRQVDYSLEEYPKLKWGWRVDRPINSSLDERTPAGDDHPARIYVSFDNGDGEDQDLELVWGNQITKQQLLFVNNFPHYIVRGGNQNVKKWFNEEVDLNKIYQMIWGEASQGVRVTDVGIFCDSDDTKSITESYFSHIRASK